MQSGEGVLVHRRPLGLADRRLVPVEPQGPQIIELGLLVLAARALRVEILDADQEPRRL
jgi:hypothetical protein